MQWTDEGVVLGIRRQGEANAVLELMTREHGRHLGLVRGGAGSRLRPVLQPGNSVQATWRARLDDQLGFYTVEGLKHRAGPFLTSSHAVYAVTHLAALVRLLPERDPHAGVHDDLAVILDAIEDPILAAIHVVQFEMQMLAEFGFGLDLTSCAATGQDSDLIYVSPRSGRAVSREAGRPWHDQLLALPAFLNGEDHLPTSSEIEQGFTLTGYFLSRHVFEPRSLPLPDARTHFISSVARIVPDSRVS